MNKNVMSIVAKLLAVILILFLGGIKLWGGEHKVANSEKAIISNEGKALLFVIVSPNAEAKTKKSAEKLARYLSKISGCEFKLETGDGKAGIAVGTVNDFQNIPFKPQFDLVHPGERQGYEIKSHKDGIYVIGATSMAVDYAVYHLLRELGYRRFFPMRKWEIIPSKNHLKFAVHIRETPDYYSRRIWPGFGNWAEFRSSKVEWDNANGGNGYRLSTGHAYNNIIKKNKKEFDAHPEYYGLINGERKSSKFCISNPGLRKLISDYAVRYFEHHPAAGSISMDPSDGGGWCECAECAKLGSPSDRALLLANTVAKVIRKKFKGKKVGMYAYNQHSPPPNIDVDPDVVINVATSFIRGGYTLDDIIDGWRKKHATIGIREYYDVYIWSYNAPGRSRGSNIKYLSKTINDFYKKGARYLTAEASDDWGPSGLGYYLAQRMMWNLDNSKKLDEHTSDFLSKCFGPAAGTMKTFYQLLDGSNKPRLCPDLIGRLYRFLEQARKEVAGKTQIISRLNDLVLYVRYSEITMTYLSSSGKNKISALKKMFRLAAAMKASRMVHSRAIYREVKRLARQSKTRKNVLIAEWDNAEPVNGEQIQSFIDTGIKNNELVDFSPVSFSSELVPVPAFMKLSPQKSKQGLRRRRTVEYFIWIDKELKPVKLSVTGGLIKHYRDRGNVKIKLYKIGGASDTGTRETLVQTDSSVPPDGKTRTVTLKSEQSGLHKMIISDGGDMTRVEWAGKTPVTLLGEDAEIKQISGTFYFYVPKGTKKLGFYCNMRRGYIVSPDKKKVFSFKKTLGYHSLVVPAGSDGKIWQFRGIAGNIELLTVPPCLALEPRALLLPKEVVEKDKL